MKLNAGIITDKLLETKQFYRDILNFGTTFENEFYVLLHTPNRQTELSFLLPNHPTQHSLFHPAFDGKGVFLTIETENVDEEYARISALGIPIVVDLRDESWGDRHFAIVDPNGIGIDLVTYAPPTEA
ncbi:VOC family protein [Spirosoma endbachense]|uniref:Glyoxalase n=1 Tax=Spirosoma endbachense TaxID=2666025 RepID=A0A6P1VPZ0_9BACT|nr:VOC family protein [Spirosoma endbachense]QHV94684.1 glyoxalase [Spirosoma endbachense]